jgi:hypothetical protein
VFVLVFTDAGMPSGYRNFSSPVHSEPAFYLTDHRRSGIINTSQPALDEPWGSDASVPRTRAVLVLVLSFLFESPI